nr:protocadherin-16 isoform X1 [Helicoverpa armigera]
MRAVSLCLALLVLARHIHAQGLSWRVGEASAAPAPPATVAAIALSIKSRAHTERLGAIQDSRCYLMNGGAVESFFISEDTPVGSVIGTLSVNGDPSEEQGDITLRLQEKGAAVGIAPGTKNLTLLRALDREEKLGPSNVYVNVRCDRRRTTDPSFIIPVSVRVWDVNDNAPAWLGAPYRARLSELTAPGTRLALGARAADADQPGPHATIHYSVLPGPHHEYLGFPNELDSVLVVKKPLDYETLRNFTVTLRAQDAGTPPLHNDTVLHVQVLDADDQNPKFTHEHYTATLPEDAKEGTILATSPGPISAADQDLGINAPLQYSATGDNARLVLVDKDTGQVAATKQLIEELSQPVTIVIKATQVDNSDRYALCTLGVSRAGAARGVRFRRRQYAAAVSEAAPLGDTLLTLHTQPPPQHNLQNNLQFYVSDRSFLDKFAINSAGEVVLRRPLDYETADSYHYQVMVTDGVSNDTASINITVLNVNEWEPRFRYPQYEFRVDDDAGDAELLPVGKLDVFDGDKQDNVTLTLRGSGADALVVNASGGVWVRSSALRAHNASVLHVVATARDSGAPPRQTSVPVTVHLRRPGAAGAGGAGGAAEGGVVLMFGGALAALALLVCALLGYIYTVRRRSKRSAGGTGSGYVTHEKPPAAPTPATTHVPASTGVTGVLPTAGVLRPAGSAGSLLSVSAGASTILANSTSSLDLQQEAHSAAQGHHNNSARQSQRIPRSKVAPLTPGPLSSGPASSGPGSAGGGVASLMSDHLGARGAGRSGVAWPSATIPARVKKLSWDDAAHDNKRGGADRRHEPHAGRPHEPHRLLLTEGPGPSEHKAQTYHNQALDENNRVTEVKNKGLEDQNVTEAGTVRQEGKPVNRTACQQSNDKYHKDTINNHETKNDVPLPGSTKTYLEEKGAPSDNYRPSDPLNTVGIPIYNNSSPHNYMYSNHPVSASNFYIPGLSEPSSPSNYSTMAMSHPGHPSHAIILQNDRPPSSRPVPTHILLTSNHKRTKHLKPPSNNKLKSKPVTIHHITPICYPVQSSSQSALFHPPASNYALPVSHPHASQQPISIIPATHYLQREPNQNDQRYASPSAPVLYEEEPSPLGSSGLPPAYATIDPKKLRAMHIRPAVFKRKVLANNKQYQLL